MKPRLIIKKLIPESHHFGYDCKATIAFPNGEYYDVVVFYNSSGIVTFSQGLDLLLNRYGYVREEVEIER